MEFIPHIQLGKPAQFTAQGSALHKTVNEMVPASLHCVPSQTPSKHTNRRILGDDCTDLTLNIYV